MSEPHEGAADAVGVAEKRPNLIAELKRRKVFKVGATAVAHQEEAGAQAHARWP